MKRMYLTIDNETKMGYVIDEKGNKIDFYNDGTEKKPIMIQLAPDTFIHEILDIDNCEMCGKKNYVNKDLICYWCVEK